MNELKTCPFCGGDAEVVRCGTPRQSSQIGCTQCNCRLESSGQGLRSGDAWNTRDIPELPPVSPEDMVDGRFYVGVRRSIASYEHPGEHYAFVNIGVCRVENILHTTCLQMAGTEIPVRQFEVIYGPLVLPISGDVEP